MEALGLAWSQDESKAFLLSKNEDLAFADLLTVIRDPHNWRGVMDASTYKVPKTYGAQVLHNDASILSALSSDSAGGEEERLLIVKQYELTVVRIYE